MNVLANPHLVPRLSVCIPTYNFGRFIGEALESMLCQMQPEVEIVVLDSASTDDTPSVVRRLQERHASLRYVRAGERGGIDRDMDRVVQLARGDYCWLFSADDVMVQGAIAQVLAHIDHGQDLILCMHSNDSFTMQPVDASHPVLSLMEPESFQLADAGQQSRYFSLATTTEAFFSFMGGLIVRKAAWNAVPLNEAFVGTCWAHVARLFELAATGLNVKFLPRVYVRRRADNDSFGTRGVVHRYALAIEGFQRIAGHFWGPDSRQAFHIRRVLRNEFRLGMFLEAKRQCALVASNDERRLLDQLVDSLYADRTFICRAHRIAYRALPGTLVQPARLIYRFLHGKTAL